MAEEASTGGEGEELNSPRNLRPRHPEEFHSSVFDVMAVCDEPSVVAVRESSAGHLRLIARSLID